MTSVEIDIPNFDEMIEEVVQQYIDNHDFNEYINYDDFINRDEAWDIAREAVDDSDYPESSGTDIYELNNLLGQVTSGTDCSDGDPFREAVKAIINAQILTNGATSVSDGTPMTLKVTGEEREIQAILTRRKEYFEDVIRELHRTFEFSPGYSNGPEDNNGSEWLDDIQAKTNTHRNELKAEALSSAETVTVDLTLYTAYKTEHSKLVLLAGNTMELVALLHSLYEGKDGPSSLRISRTWRNAANYALDNRIPAPETINATTTTNDEDTDKEDQ